MRWYLAALVSSGSFPLVTILVFAASTPGDLSLVARLNSLWYLPQLLYSGAFALMFASVASILLTAIKRITNLLLALTLTWLLIGLLTWTALSLP